MPSSQTMSYKYNSDGIRTQKTFTDNAVKYYYKHDYILDGANIVAETITYFTYFGTNTTETLYYYYDESGAPTGIKYNGNVYYFQKNLQGDIIRILNSSGSIVATYTYDAWGNIISSTDTSGVSIGTKNPFRYRGYYFDTETGLYYLNSRYYDPQVGRFINADAVIAGINSDVKGYNMFAYCFNNPVNMTDSFGNWPSWGQVFAAVATVAVAAVFVVAVVASAGAVGVAAGVAAASIGATGTMVSAAIAVGTFGTYAVATGIGACALSNAGEILTGTNFIRDELLGGNQEAYDTLQTALNIAGGGAVIIGQTNPGVTGNAAKPKQNAQTVHKVPTTSTANTSFDKLYPGKTGDFQRTYYDFRGNMSLQIDFTVHNDPLVHSNPHLHRFWLGERQPQFNLWYLE